MKLLIWICVSSIFAEVICDADLFLVCTTCSDLKLPSCPDSQSFQLSSLHTVTQQNCNEQQQNCTVVNCCEFCNRLSLLPRPEQEYHNDTCYLNTNCLLENNVSRTDDSGKSYNESKCTGVSYSCMKVSPIPASTTFPSEKTNTPVDTASTSATLRGVTLTTEKTFSPIPANTTFPSEKTNTPVDTASTSATLRGVTLTTEKTFSPTPANTTFHSEKTNTPADTASTSATLRGVTLTTEKTLSSSLETTSKLDISSGFGTSNPLLPAMVTILFTIDSCM